MLYKMYYKSKIELIHLFVTKTKCHIFLQVNIFNKKISDLFFREFPVLPGPDRDGTSSGRDGTWDRNPVPSLFRDGTRDKGVPILSRPMNTPTYFYV